MHHAALDAELDLVFGWHCEQALDVILPAAAAYDGSDEDRTIETILTEPRERLVSIGIYAASAAVSWQPLPERFVTPDIYTIEPSDRFARDLLATLRRRKLPYSPMDAAILLTLATHPFDAEVLGFAVAAADHVFGSYPGHPRVLAALISAKAILEQQPIHRYAIPELRQRVKALVAANAPAGLLDLSVVELTDDWGPKVREAATVAAESSDDVQGLFTRLAAATSAKQSQRWHREVRGFVEGSATMAELLRTMLVAFVEAPLSPIPEDEIFMAGSSWLVSRSNAVLLRGAAVSTQYVDEPWVAPLLGAVALRGAARHPEQYVTEALCAKATSGAIEALAARMAAGEAESERQLRLLVTEITRGDIRKRITAVLAA
ncbi:MAG: hypothetical protein ACRDO2_11745 [Nocardioidaceae bacterium]